MKLGDKVAKVIKKVLKVKPCAGCIRRKNLLNRIGKRAR